ncbi:hypothetical protein ACLKA6_010498 [Drosophila palustris]
MFCNGFSYERHPIAPRTLTWFNYTESQHLIYFGKNSFDQLNRMLFQFLLLLRIQNVRFHRLAFGDKFGVHVLYRFYT